MRALRAAEIDISPAEAIDAHLAAAAVGLADRDLLRDALCVTLAKSAAEVARFEICFDTLFARAEFADGDGGAASEAQDGASLTELVLAGDAAALAGAMEAAGRGVGAGDITLMTQRGLMRRRMLDAMGLRELEATLQALNASAEPDDRALAERLAAGRAGLFEEAGRYVDRQAALFAGETGRRLRERILGAQSLTSIGQEDLRAMEALTRRMARRLATKHSRRRRRAKTGRLDPRRTLRRSLGHGGVPFEIVWKSRTIERPRIVAICDVSRSVAGAAQFLLLLLHGLHEAVEHLDAYAFSDRLVKVNDLLEDGDVDQAIALILARIGFRPTDYGAALEDLFDHHASSLDRHTTVIILGDARTNHADPRLDLMRRLSDQARAVIWLNPEPETYWRQGDSRMDDYRRFCRVARSCNTLNGLERVIDEVLAGPLSRRA